MLVLYSESCNYYRRILLLIIYYSNGGINVQNEQVLMKFIYQEENFFQWYYLVHYTAQILVDLWPHSNDRKNAPGRLLKPMTAI